MSNVGVEEAPLADGSRSQANSAQIGYRHPPVGFRKGQSGNPAGRPKGSKNKQLPHGERLRALMLEEAYRPVSVSEEDGNEIILPVAQAVFRSLAQAAAKGEARAQAMFLKFVSATEDEAAAYEAMLDDELERRNANELTAPSRIEVRIVDPLDVNKMK